MTDAQIHASVAAYYSDRVRKYGATAAGVDWRDEASQELRFAQFQYLWRRQQGFSLNDLGCGYGALYAYLRKRRKQVTYLGIDLSDDMLAIGRKRYRNTPSISFTQGSSPPGMATYTVASGIFNVKGDPDPVAWRDYVFRTIASMAEHSEEGFAFNVLSDHSDKHLQRPDLYYADPAEMVDHCGRTISRHLMLVQDYGLYEFTLIVRL